MPGTGSIGGLISGLDTATIIDQLISVSKKRIDVVVANQTEKSDKIEAYQGFNLKLADFQSSAETLSDSDTFNVFKTATSTNSTDFTADNLVSVSTTTDASPGTHTIEFTAGSQLAQTRQISSKSYSDYNTTALNLSGEILINGSVIKIASTDTLEDIGVKINNANSGTNATKVTASIIAVSDTDARLILTSDVTGEDKFDILEASATDILTSLGFTSGSAVIKNATSDGATSDAFSNSQTAVASLLSLTSPPASGLVSIGGTDNVTIDLSTESLTTIAANINTALGASGSATVVSETTDGVTTYRIDINGTTSISDNNNTNILYALGILEGVNSDVNEIHAGSVANLEGGGAIDTNTYFNAIDSTTVDTSDTITISGTKNDGSAITTTSFDIYSGAYKQISDLLAQIETLYGGASIVDAYVSDGTDGNTAGQIAIKDLTAGDSQLSLTLVANNEGSSSTLNFGILSASTEGYSMQTTAGQDAKVKIDGIAVTRDNNLIDDVISGVTLDISRIDDGSTVNINISRDTDSIKDSVSNFITQYNSIIEFINVEFKFNEDLDEAGILSGESTLSSIKTSIQSIITGTISLLPTGSNAISLIGITSDNDGKLTLKDSTFLSEINSDFNAVMRMFIPEGTATNSEVTYIGHTKNTSAGDYDVNITQAATKAGVTGVDLSSGIGAGSTDTIMITDTASGRVATITLDGDPLQNGSSIDNIVNAINSELDTETTQTLVGDNANTTDGTTPITSSTTFNNINGAGLSDGQTITYTGKTRSGIAVNGSYLISNVSTDTVQNFLSAIENDFDNNVSATIDSSGKLVLTDNTVGDSLLEITITEPGSPPLDFGTVTTSNPGGVAGRYAMEITASIDGSDHLVITHNSYGSGNGFTTTETNDLLGTEGTYAGIDVAGTINGEAATGTGQLLRGDDPGDGSSSVRDLAIKVTSTSESLVGSVANTINGTDAIVAGTLFSGINGAGVVTGETITISGKKHDGTPVNYIYTLNTANAVSDLLTSIKDNFGLGGTPTIDSSGKIAISDTFTGDSQLSISLLENNEVTGSLDFGDIIPGAKDTIKLTMGVAETMYNKLLTFTDSIDGLVTIRIDGLGDTVDNLQETIDGMNERLAIEALTLNNKFVQLELSLSKLQSVSNFLAQQLAQLSK